MNRRCVARDCHWWRAGDDDCCELYAVPECRYYRPAPQPGAWRGAVNWACYWLVIVLPQAWLRPGSWLLDRLLPRAGEYAYEVETRD